jgi:ubiquinone/menaquinone biosynthesis C-methylase UbiE
MQQSTTALLTQLHPPETIFTKVKTWISASQNKTINSWIVEQLHVQPYQHILEIGYGAGNSLYEVAKKLQVGFLAGVDDSVDYYQQATRRNKKFIDEELLHLHLGCVEQLPYPAHYFHSIYTGNIYYSWNEPQYKFMQLHSLLKSGGKLITVVQPSDKLTEKEIWNEAEKIQQQYIEAGFFDVRFAFHEMHAVNAISVVGYKE